MVLGVLAGCWLGFLLIRQGGDVLRLRAIVVRKSSKSKNDLEKRAALLRQDSVHGSFKGTIRVLHETDTLVANGNPIRIIYSDKPEDINYHDYDLINPLVIDNTGVWTDRDNLNRHLVLELKKYCSQRPPREIFPILSTGLIIIKLIRSKILFPRHPLLPMPLCRCLKPFLTNTVLNRVM